jgi:hypothetical protein
MKSIFDPVVDTIQALIESVMTEARKNKPDKPLVVGKILCLTLQIDLFFYQGIILVGGFGESVYLYKRLNTWAGAQNPKLFVGSPRNS